MEIARWLIVFVAFITGTGGLFADYVIPPSAAQHMCRAALKSRTCIKDDELLQINPGFRKRIMHLNPGLGTRQNEEEGADSGVNEMVET